MDDPRYTLSEVAAAADIQVGTLRSYLQRRHWRIDLAVGDSPSDIAGKAHLVTLRRGLQVGVAAELIRQDVEPSRAFQAAWDFSDLYDPLEADGHVREPGKLYPEPAQTLLVAYKGGPVAGVVMRVDAKTPMTALLFHRLAGDRPPGGTFVWLNPIVKRVKIALEG